MFLKHEAKREGKRKGKEAEREEERMDNWHSSSLLLLTRPSPAECRAVAQLLAPIVSHKAGRNVWPALWETALQASQLLSRPRGLEFCHTGLNGDELAERLRLALFFSPSPSSSSSSLLPDGKLWEDVKLKPGPAALMPCHPFAPREHPSHHFTATWTCTKKTINKQEIIFPSFAPP